MIKRISKIIISAVLTVSITMTSVQLPAFAMEQSGAAQQNLESVSVSDNTAGENANDWAEPENMSDDDKDATSSDDYIDSDDADANDTKDFEDIFEKHFGDESESENEDKEYQVPDEMEDLQELDGEEIAATGDFAGGTGTENNPYIINLPKHLMECLTNPQYGKYYKMTDNIIMSLAGTVTIPNRASTIHFDGNDHYITDMTIKNDASSTCSSLGVFGDCGTGSTFTDLELRDLTIEYDGTVTNPNIYGFGGRGKYDNCEITGDFNVYIKNETAKSLYISGISHQPTYLKNCKFAANLSIDNRHVVSESQINNNTFVSGMAYSVPASSDGVIEECVNSGNIFTEKGTVSGIVYESKVKIDSCEVTKNAAIVNYGTTGSSGTVNGIANDAYTYVTNCRNAGLLAGYHVNGIADLVGGSSAVSSYAQFSNCHNEGQFQLRDGGTLCILAGNVGYNEDLTQINVFSCSNKSDIETNATIAGLFGTVGNGNMISIHDCYNEGNLTSNKGSAVGIVGNISQSYKSTRGVIIDECYNKGIITAGGGGSSDYAAGIVGCSANYYYGYKGPVTIKNCYNDEGADITAKGNFGDAAGIVGKLILGNITNCYNKASVTSEHSDAGGIAAVIEGDNEKSVYAKFNYITKCFNSGYISASQCVGGIAGKQTSGIIECSYNTGNVARIGTSFYPIGGLVGSIEADKSYSDEYNNVFIHDCFNAGTLDASNGRSSAVIGGIVGKVEYESGITSDLETSINNCYNIGTINPPTNDGFKSSKMGAVVGETALETGALTVTNVYYFNQKYKADNSVVKDTSGDAAHVSKSGIKSCSLAEMAKKSTFSTFDFDTVWTMLSADGVYPYPYIIDVDCPALEIDDESVIKGKIGSLIWKITGDTLTIKGAGKIPNYGIGNKAPWYEYKNQISHIAVGEGVTALGDECFQGLDKAEDVLLPSTLNTIGASSFYSCSNLYAIDIPASVTLIDRWAFAKCANIESVVVPDGVTELSNNVFDGCSELNALYLPSSLEKIGAGAILHCHKLRVVRFDGDKSEYDRIQKSDFENHLKKNSMSVCLNNDKYTGYYKYAPFNDGSISVPYNFYADFDWFLDTDPRNYNDDIADLSIRGAMSAFALSDWDYSVTEDGKELVDIYRNPKHFSENAANIDLHNSQNVQKFMEAMEFENIEIDYPVPESDSIGYSIGSRTIQNGSKRSTLIFVPIRGAGYGTEWAGNFNVGDNQKEHKGFDLAAKQVVNGIDSYIQRHKSDFEDDIKVWLVGYSRAAATANLTAAKLDDGAIAGVNNSNVFAYCFECPQNTTDSNYKNSKYNNIISIVNPIDFVTKVAPTAKWKFHRYGITYVLPTVQNTSNFYVLDAAMNTQYRAILKVARDNGAPSVSDKAFKNLVNPYKTQNAIEEDVIDLLMEVVGSRSNYANKWQKKVQSAVRGENALDCGGAVGIVLKKLAEMVIEDKADEFIKNRVGDYVPVYNMVKIFYKAAVCIYWLDRLAPLLSELEKSDFYTRNYFMPIDEYLVSLASDPEGTVNFTMSLLGEIFSNIAVAHYPELCLAWMDTLSGEQIKKTKAEERMYINCPVDVVVKDSSGNVVAKIENNQVADIENGLAAYIDSDGQKVVSLPSDDNYSVDVIGNEELAEAAPESDSDLTMSFMKYDGDASEPQGLISYAELPLEQNDAYKAYVSTGNVLVSNSDKAILDADINIDGDVPQYSLTVDVVGDGNVTSSSSYYLGEFAEVIAHPYRDGESIPGNIEMEESDFIGWFAAGVADDAEPLSTDESYRFVMNSDVHIEARFRDISGQMWVSGIDKNGYTYTGAAIKPEVVVYDGKTLLDPKTDYTISYVNNTNVYTIANTEDNKDRFDPKKAPAVVITGKGNYKDKEYIYFTINPKSIEDEDVTVADIALVNVKTSAQKPVPAVKWGKKSLTNKKDYQVSYYTDRDKETGELSGLVAGPDADSKTGPQAADTYYVLVEGKYDATAIGSFCNYTGSVVKEFVIAADKQTLITKPTLNKIKDKPYTGEAVYPSQDEIDKLLKNGTYYLKAGSPEKNPEGDYDYEISYSPEVPVDAGIVTITLTARDDGAYIGSRTTSYKITATALSKTKMNKFESKLAYADGKAVTQSVFEDGFFYTESGRGAAYVKHELQGKEASDYDVLSAEEKRAYDYTYEYSNNIYAGKASVTFTGVNGYEGTVKKEYTITGKALSSAYFDSKTLVSAFDYDGTAHTQDSATFYVSKNSSEKLTEGRDYSVTYQKNIDAGTATVIFKGIGGYTGEVKKTYKINAYDATADQKKTADKQRFIIEIDGYDSEGVEFVKGGVKPEITIKFLAGAEDQAKEEIILKEKTDYTVAYAKNTAVYKSQGDSSVDSKKAPSITVTMKGNYKNKAVKYFDIRSKKLDSSDITVSAYDAVYKKSAGAWKVTPTLTDKDGKKLSAGTDYSKNIVYRYKTIPEEAENNILDGSSKTPVPVERKAGDEVGAKDIVPAGVVISMEISAGSGNLYSGSRMNIDSYRVVGADISKVNANVKVAKSYTGKAVTLDPSELELYVGSGKSKTYLNGTVDPADPDDNAKALDYRIVPGSYKNNILKGKATVEIEGLNNYGGRKVISFTIGQRIMQWWWNLLQ